MSPELSVTLATHNRQLKLGRCLEALERQTLEPERFEVVVADDGSSDGTLAMLEGLETAFELKVLDLGKVGRVAARNAAVEAARGGICLVIDDDVVAEPELLAEHLEAHRAGPVLGIGRMTQPSPEGRDWYAAAFADGWNDHFDRLERGGVDWTDAYSGNLSAPRETLLEVGGFRERTAGEDSEVGYLLERAGCAVRYLPRANAVHDDVKPGSRLIADSLRQGRGQLELLEEHPEMLPRLFGWFLATTRREVALRRAMLALRVPPRLLAGLGALLPGRGRRLVWFHFVSRYAFWLGVRAAVDRGRWQRMTRGVPVLMYHAFGRGDEGDRYVVPRRAFALQLRLLKLLGYRGIRFGELVADLRAGRLPPRRAVVITIDDGYRDNLELALPLLRRHGYPASIFPVSGCLGGVNDWSSGDALRGRPMLSWEEVAELRRQGVEVGAHTRNHTSLRGLPRERLVEEIAGSRADLEGRLGAPVASFAYPYGELDDEAVAATAEAGFAAACTVEPRLARLAEDPLRIPRVEVRSGDSLPRFLLNLLLGMR